MGDIVDTCYQLALKQNYGLKWLPLLTQLIPTVNTQRDYFQDIE